MAAVMPVHLMELSRHKGPEDFKTRVWGLLKAPLEGYRTTGREVLVATYIETEMTKGGIIKPNNSVAEPLFQGKVGLVLQLGPMAFKYDLYGHKWEGVSFDVNDWVILRFADSWNIHLAGVDCKIVDFESIRAVVDDPTVVL